MHNGQCRVAPYLNTTQAALYKLIHDPLFITTVLKP